MTMKASILLTPLVTALLLLACDTVNPEVPQEWTLNDHICAEVGVCDYSYTINGRLKVDTIVWSTYLPHVGTPDYEYMQGPRFSIRMYATEAWAPPLHLQVIELRLDDFPEVGEVINVGQVDWDEVRRRGGRTRAADRGIRLREDDVDTPASVYYAVPSERNEMVVTGYEYDDTGNVTSISGTFEATLARSWYDTGSMYAVLEDTLRIREGSFRSRVDIYTPPGWEP